MLHLPLDYPRGLVQKTPRFSADGQTVTVTYAYVFPGCHDLSIPLTPAHRPRERMPRLMYQRLRDQGVLRFKRDYDVEHGQGKAMTHKPTFALQEV